MVRRMSSNDENTVLICGVRNSTGRLTSQTNMAPDESAFLLFSKIFFYSIKHLNINEYN